MARKMKDSGIEWIGEIPEGWEVVPVRSCFDEVRTKNTDGQEQNALQFKSGNIISKANFNANIDDYVADTITNYTVVLPDTVMINGLNLNYDFKSLRVALVKEKGVITSAYLAIFPDRKKISPQYATYLFKGYETKMAFHNMGAGIRKTLGYKEFKNQPLLLPSKEEQNKISAYLDSKCSHIDIMLSKIRSSIEEYKKLKQAVITQAVATQQCSHIKLKYLMNVIVDCPHETPTYSFTGNYYVIRTADQALASLRCDEDMYRLDASEYKKRTRRLTLDKDDIVYGREGERWGLACIVPESNKYCLGQRIMQFRCNTKFLYPKYAMYALNSEPVYLQGVADTIGSTSPHVNISTVCNYLLPVPALTEQKEIANYLDAKCAEIDRLIAKKEQLAKELESYKKSLIYEVVTGKREV